MRITLIAAMSPRRVIGAGNRLPWRLPADLRRFKELTMGKPLIMGRKTCESIGRALPGRRTIVLSHRAELPVPGCQLAHSLLEALALAEPADEVMIAGGATVYAEALPLCQRIYLTIVDIDVAGDAFFPLLPEGAFREVSRQDFAADALNPYRHCLLTLESSQAGRDTTATALPAAP